MPPTETIQSLNAACYRPSTARVVVLGENNNSDTSSTLISLHNPSNSQNSKQNGDRSKSSNGGGASVLLSLLWPVKNRKYCANKSKNTKYKNLNSRQVDGSPNSNFNDVDGKINSSSRLSKQSHLKPMEQLDSSLHHLMNIVKNKSDEAALSPDDECVTCVTRRACIQIYPCGHKVLCEKCFVKLLQMNYIEGKFPITCFFCRSPMALFKRQDAPCNISVKSSVGPASDQQPSSVQSVVFPKKAVSIKAAFRRKKYAIF